MEFPVWWRFAELVLFSGWSIMIASCSGGEAVLQGSRRHPEAVEAGASSLASERYPGDGEARERYKKELLELLEKAGDKDFALVYNTGGFGGFTMAADPDWGSIVEGTAGRLRKLGFSAVILEHQRSENTVPAFLGEVIELVRCYPDKAQRLAEKLDFLLHYRPSLKVIVTGRSHGGVFGNQAMNLLAGQPRAYAIFAGTPFWYSCDFGERSLIIRDNGVQPDAFHTGDWRTILKANLHLPRGEPPPGGAIQILKWYINMPGHEYTWDYPGIRSEVESFLNKITSRIER